jgi:hypothetical protein
MLKQLLNSIAGADIEISCKTQHLCRHLWMDPRHAHTSPCMSCAPPTPLHWMV